MMLFNSFNPSNRHENRLENQPLLPITVDNTEITSIDENTSISQSNETNVSQSTDINATNSDINNILSQNILNFNVNDLFSREGLQRLANEAQISINAQTNAFNVNQTATTNAINTNNTTNNINIDLNQNFNLYFTILAYVIPFILLLLLKFIIDHFFEVLTVIIMPSTLFRLRTWLNEQISLKSRCNIKIISNILIYGCVAVFHATLFMSLTLGT